jgi:signal transduction histidine kinase
MKLARKLTLWLVLGISAVLAVHFALSIRREQDFLHADSQRDNQLVGRALVAIVSEIVRAEGDAEALELIDRANERDPSVSFRWVVLDPAGATTHLPEAPLARLRSAAEGTEVVELQRRADEDRLLTYVPFRLASGRAAAIEVAQSLAEKQRYGRATIVSTVVTSLSLAIVAIAVAIATGVWVVGRPIRALAAKARRIGEGDLSGPLELAQNDEVGELAREMNRMCARLAEAQGQLASETAARIAAIEQLQHAERLAVVGKLASGIAHELGTPLQVISGWAKMIRGGELEGGDVGSAADTIATQSDRMAKSIRGLLDFARRRDAEKRRLDVRDVVRETTSFLQPLAEKRSVAIHVEGEDEPHQVDADAGQIQQALTNLVINGFDALGGAGKLTIALDEAVEAPPPEVGGEAVQHVRIAVRDEGAGIAPEDLGRVFDPFFTTKDVGQGTGLGLSVAQGIVREHGGWIDVDSERGRGTTFTIHLPSRETP